MPMLDEQEFAIVSQLYRESIRGVKAFREKTGSSLEDSPVDAIFQPVREEYERLTGMKDCHHNAILHHRLSNYGPPCGRCGKPLRTPKAKVCGSCMFPVRIA